MSFDINKANRVDKRKNYQRGGRKPLPKDEAKLKEVEEKPKEGKYVRHNKLKGRYIVGHYQVEGKEYIGVYDKWLMRFVFKQFFKKRDAEDVLLEVTKSFGIRNCKVLKGIRQGEYV